MDNSSPIIMQVFGLNNSFQFVEEGVFLRSKLKRIVCPVFSNYRSEIILLYDNFRQDIEKQLGRVKNLQLQSDEQGAEAECLSSLADKVNYLIDLELDAEC